MNERLLRALERKIASHNRLANLTSLGAALGIVLLWAALYFVLWWLAVMFNTVRLGVDAEQPVGVHRNIGIILAVWLGLGIIDRLRDNDEPKEYRAVWERFLDIALLPAKATLGVWDNFRSRVKLNEAEMVTATNFLERLFRAGRMTADVLPEEIPDESVREHILTALRTTELVWIREHKGVEILSIANPQRLVPFLQT